MPRRAPLAPPTPGHVLALLVLAAALPAAAQGMPPEELAQACRRLPVHVPDRDVAYQPGVDARGRAVAPADLPEADPAPPLQFSIPLTLDSARQLGVAVPTPGGATVPGTMELGRLTITGNEVAFNGQPLNQTSRSRFVALCRELGYRSPPR